MKLKTQIVMQIKNLNCEETPLNGDKTQNSNYDETQKRKL